MFPYFQFGVNYTGRANRIPTSRYILLPSRSKAFSKSAGTIANPGQGVVLLQWHSVASDVLVKNWPFQEAAATFGNTYLQEKSKHLRFDKEFEISGFKQAPGLFATPDFCLRRPLTLMQLAASSGVSDRF